MDLADAMGAWRDFYVAAAGVGAVLLGLVFVVAGLDLALAAVGLAIALEPALYAIGLVVLVFIAFGMQNAWDTLLRRDLRDRLTAEGDGPDR